MSNPDFMCSSREYFVSFSPPEGFWSLTCGPFTAHGTPVHVHVGGLRAVPGYRNEDLFLEHVEGSYQRWRAYVSDYGRVLEEDTSELVIDGRRACVTQKWARFKKQDIKSNGVFVEFGGPSGPWVLSFSYSGGEVVRTLDDEALGAIATVHTELDERPPATPALARYWLRHVGVDLPSAWEIDAIGSYEANFARAFGSEDMYGYNAKIHVGGLLDDETIEGQAPHEQRFLEQLAKSGRTARSTSYDLSVDGVALSEVFSILVDPIEFPPSVEELDDGPLVIPDSRNRAGFVRYQGYVRVGARYRVRVSIQAEAQLAGRIDDWWRQTLVQLAAPHKGS